MPSVINFYFINKFKYLINYTNEDYYYICEDDISLSKNYFGYIYIWLDSNDYIAKICDSFDKFVDQIQFENEM